MINFFKIDEKKLLNIFNIILAMISVFTIIYSIIEIADWPNMTEEAMEYLAKTGSDTKVDYFVMADKITTIVGTCIAILSTVLLIVRNLKLKDRSQFVKHMIVQYVIAFLIVFLISNLRL